MSFCKKCANIGFFLHHYSRKQLYFSQKRKVYPITEQNFPLLYFLAIKMMLTADEHEASQAYRQSLKPNRTVASNPTRCERKNHPYCQASCQR